MNEPEIDPVRLMAEADAAVADAPPELGAPTPEGEGAAPVAESWAPMVASVTPVLTMGVFPQWNITPEERAEFSTALGQCLDQIFPGGPVGKYLCWVQLIATCGGIVAGRFLAHGKIPPLGPKRKETKADAASTAGGNALSPA